MALGDGYRLMYRIGLPAAVLSGIFCLYAGGKAISGDTADERDKNAVYAALGTHVLLWGAVGAHQGRKGLQEIQNLPTNDNS